MEIDINCDLGESQGSKIVGNDEAVFPHITSCNIACGFHGGDPYTMEQTIYLAAQSNVQIGAHPSYPDPEGFGRRPMEFNSEELKAIIKYQVAALQGMAKSKGQSVKYVKPHGALYHQMVQNEDETKCVIEAIQEIDPNLQLMGLAGSKVGRIAKTAGIRFIAEGFADRRYERSGQLVSRKKNGAVIHHAKEAAEQVISMVLDKRVKSISGDYIPVNVESICVHSDHPEVLNLLKAIDTALEKNGIVKKAFAQ